MVRSRRRHQHDLRLEVEQPEPPSALGVSLPEGFPAKRTGIGSAFSDEDILLMISIWDEEHRRKSKSAKKR
jgi:hypothetical protein